MYFLLVVTLGGCMTAIWGLLGIFLFTNEELQDKSFHRVVFGIFAMIISLVIQLAIQFIVFR